MCMNVIWETIYSDITLDSRNVEYVEDVYMTLDVYMTGYERLNMPNCTLNVFVPTYGLLSSLVRKV